MFEVLKKYKLLISIGILTVFYVVGLIGILFSDDRADFASLSWLNLCISAVVLFWNHERWNKGVILSLSGVGILGFLVEVLGVQTGEVFGEYSYGDALGIKWFEVPLVIGLNWVMLCYFSVYSLSTWIKQWWLLSSAAALLLIGLDFIIEPVAIKLDFWHWSRNEIPVQNFVAWFIIAAVFNKLIAITKADSSNKLAIYLFAIQLIFFLILRFEL